MIRKGGVPAAPSLLFRPFYAIFVREDRGLERKKFWFVVPF